MHKSKIYKNNKTDKNIFDLQKCNEKITSFFSQENFF